MSSRFEWKTEEDLLWQEQRERGKRPRRPSNRFLLAAFLILAMISAGITLILRQIEQQAEEISATVSEEILASQRVWLNALKNNDADLYATVLSGSQPNWMDAQYDRLLKK